jgi:hypothetical protein
LLLESTKILYKKGIRCCPKYLANIEQPAISKGIERKECPMKQYKIFKHPSGTTEAVKQGWSWPAFLFSFVWALVKKMWAIGIGLFILSLIFISMVGREADILINGISVVVSVIFGMYGNSWREKNLESRGYEMKDTVTAANPGEAIAKFTKV